jgi:hypothetical protein
MLRGETTWSIGSFLYSCASKLCITCSNCVISRWDRLFRDHTAGDPVASIPCRIGLHVIRLGVNHQCRSAIAEQGVAVVAESDVLVHYPELGCALGAYVEVVHVAGMVAFGILQAMLLALGIEVRSGRLEIRRVALRLLMKVQRMLPRGQAVEAELHGHARRCSLARQHCCPYALALSVFQCDRGLGRGCERQGGKQTECDGEGQPIGGFHGGAIIAL